MVITTGEYPSNKRYVKGLVSSLEFRELDFLRQTNRLGLDNLQKVLDAVVEELQAELRGIVNNDFEGFVKLFQDIGVMGEDEFLDLQDKVFALSESLKVSSMQFDIIKCRFCQPPLNWSLVQLNRL